MPPCIQHNISQRSDVASLYVYANVTSSSTCGIVPPLSSIFATAGSSSVSTFVTVASALMFAIAQQLLINFEDAKKLNYSSTSTFCADALVQNEDLMKTRERIRDKKNKGKDVHEQLKLVKKLTAGK